MRRFFRLWPLFLLVLPIGLIGRLDCDPTAPLLPYIAAALASLALGGLMARKAGAL